MIGGVGHVRKLVGATLATVGVSLAFASAAAAVPVADATCDPAGGGSINTGGNNRLGEVFTALHSAPLASVQFTATKLAGETGAADFGVSINTLDMSGVPTNTMLASQTVADPVGGAGPYLLTANFATPATVIAGTQYAVVFTRPGPNALTLEGSGDTCPGKLFIAQPDPFTEQGGFDIRFASFVDVPPIADRSPSSLAFGSQLTGTTSAQQTVTLESTGTVDLTVSSIALAGTDPGAYVFDASDCTGPPQDGVLAPTETCLIHVSFAPASAGAKSASLEIETDAGNLSTPLSGTGTSPPPVATPPGQRAAALKKCAKIKSKKKKKKCKKRARRLPV
jgi:hypothetical protein